MLVVDDGFLKTFFQIIEHRTYIIPDFNPKNNDWDGNSKDDGHPNNPFILFFLHLMLP